MKKQGVVLLLALVVTLLVNALFIVAVFHSADPLIPVFYFCCLPFYLFLYRWRRLRRSRHQDEMLRSGLGHAAAVFGMLLSVLFVYGFARHVPLHCAAAAWLFSALPLAYCYYRVLVLHLEFEEQEPCAAAGCSKATARWEASSCCLPPDDRATPLPADLPCPLICSIGAV
ncbi:hypothetical protein BS78_08G155100 [Paspalum vaginatum]|nr:hypothetical protein BS78_08G155100 [Paspalum vaginatum]